MSKKLIALSSLISVIAITGCNAGSSTTPSISASVPANTNNTSSCPTLTNNATCVISVVYNTNGASGVSLGYNSTPSPLPTNITNGTFNTTLGTCQSGVGTSSGNTTCPITIRYTSAGGNVTSSTIVFTLGSATSNTITVTGN